MRMTPAPGYRARPVAATTTCTSGRADRIRRAACENAGHSRFTSWARLPGNKPSTGRPGPEMETRIVDEDGEVVALGPKGVAHAIEQPDVRRELPQRFDEPDHGESLHAVEYDGAGGFQIRPAERLHGRGGEATLERG